MTRTRNALHGLLMLGLLLCSVAAAERQPVLSQIDAATTRFEKCRK